MICFYCLSFFAFRWKKHFFKNQTFMAASACCFVENVTNAQPLLWPFWSRSTVHSSIGPWPAKSWRTSCSLYFLLSIPTNNLRSAIRKTNRRIKINQLLQPKNQIELRFNWDKCEKSLSLRSILKLKRLSKARKMRKKRFSINPTHHISLESNWIHSFCVIKSLLKLAFHSNGKFPRYNFVNQTWTVSKIAWIAFAACMQHSNVGGNKKSMWFSRIS